MSKVIIDLNDSFRDASGYELYGDAILKNVGPDAYGVLNRDSLQDVLMTRFTIVCSGAAFVAKDRSNTVALAHFFSDFYLYHAGADAVVQHAKDSFASFTLGLDPQTEFMHAAFGGNKMVGDAPQEKPHQEKVDEMFRYLKEEADIVARPDFRAMSRQTQNSLLAACNAYFEDFETKALRFSVSRYTSGLINDTIFECVRQSGYAETAIDLRYQNSPHDAFVEKESGRIMIGHSDDDHMFTRHNVPDFDNVRLPIMPVPDYLMWPYRPEF